MINIKNFKPNNELVDFLKQPDTKQYLNKLDLDTLYAYAIETKIKSGEHTNITSTIPYLTLLLYSINIDPLKYLTYIPNSYLNYSSIDKPPKSLGDLIIPGNIQTIGDSAFYYAHIDNIVIEEGVEKLGNQAFAKVKDIKSITLPKSLKYIGGNNFYDIDFTNCYIKYNGTKKEWEDMKKDPFLFDDQKVTVYIVCQDGTIKLKPER